MRDDLTERFEWFRDSGDAGALARVFDETAPDLLRIAQHLLRDRAAAEDVVQQTFVTAIERAATFRPDSPLRPWLCGILFRHARNEWRRRARTSPRPLASATLGNSDTAFDRVEAVAIATGSVRSDASDAIDARHLRREIDRAIGELDSPYREVIAARLFDEASATEIGRTLGRAPGLVRLQIHRGLRLLRGILPRGAPAIAPLMSRAARDPRGLDLVRDALLQHANAVNTAAHASTHSILGATLVSATSKQIAAGAAVLIAIACVVVGSRALLTGEDPANAGIASEPPVVAVVDTAPAAVVEALVPQRSEVVSDGAATEPPIGARRGSGRVVGAKRMPVANAQVIASVGGYPIASTTSDERGAFAIDVPATAPRSFVLFASTDDGSCGYRKARAASAGAFDAGVVAIEPSVGLDVQVVSDAASVEGAEVVLETSTSSRTQFLEARVDAKGRAHFDRVPNGGYRVLAVLGNREARARVLLPDETSVKLVLEEAFDRDVRVVDWTTKLPISGASVIVEETSVMTGFEDDDGLVTLAFNARNSSESSRHRTITDASGNATLRGLTAQCDFVVRATAPGFLESDRRQLSNPSKPIVLELQSAGRRTVRFPIVAGERSVPAPGTPLTIVWQPAGDDYPRSKTDPGAISMGNAEIVVPDVDGIGSFLARTEDGAIAPLFVKPEKVVGETASFDRARSLRVRVKDVTGAPCTKGRISAMNGANNPFGIPVVLDATGTAVLDGLPRARVRVRYFTADDQRDDPFQIASWKIGEVDLAGGDGVLEYVLPVPATARLRVKRNGVAELPVKFRLFARGSDEDSLNGLRCSVLEEFAERGEMRVSIETDAADVGQPVTVSIAATDGNRATATVIPVASGEEPLVELVFPLVGRIDVYAERTASTYSSVHLEELDPSTGQYRPVLGRGGALLLQNGPGDCFRFQNVPAGTYRGKDEASGRYSESIVLGAGAAGTLRIRTDG